jgi:hypothetical protein
MLRNTYHRTAAGLSVLAACGALAGPAAADTPAPGPLQQDVQQVVADVSTDSAQIAVHAVDAVMPTVRSVPWSVAALQRQVRDIVRRTGVSTRRSGERIARNVVSSEADAFAVVGRTGRMVAGRNAVALSQPVAGATVVQWAMDLSGCTQVAIATDRAGSLLRVEPVSPVAVRVLQRSAAAGLGSQGFVIAAYC